MVIESTTSRVMLCGSLPERTSVCGRCEVPALIHSIAVIGLPASDQNTERLRNYFSVTDRSGGDVIQRCHWDLQNYAFIISYDSSERQYFRGLRIQHTYNSVFTARCYASPVLAMGLCPCPCLSVCVRLSQAGVLLKRQNVGSHKQQHTIPPVTLVF